jgi:methylmalonyl-CoA mutase N-terminal domain/subunit
MDTHAGSPEAAVETGRQRWQRRFAGSRIRTADFSTLSGLDVEPVYGPPEGAVVPGFDRIGWPGSTRSPGALPVRYRGRPGRSASSPSGNARQTNERYKMLLGAGTRIGGLRHHP